MSLAKLRAGSRVSTTINEILHKLRIHRYVLVHLGCPKFPCRERTVECEKHVPIAHALERFRGEQFGPIKNRKIAQSGFRCCAPDTFGCEAVALANQRARIPRSSAIPNRSLFVDVVRRPGSSLPTPTSSASLRPLACFAAGSFHRHGHVRPPRSAAAARLAHKMRRSIIPVPSGLRARRSE